MGRSPGDITTRRDAATGLQLATAVCEYLHQVPGELGFTVLTGFPLAVAADTDRRRALVFTSAIDHTTDTARAGAIKATVEELDGSGIPISRVLVTGHLRWSPTGQFPIEFGKVIDAWLSETAPDRVQELNDAFEKEFRDKGN